MMTPKHISDEIMRVIHEKMITQEKLTEDQFAEAIRQAIACGDFLKLVTTDGRQQVIYVPYREVESLKSQVRQLDAIRVAAKALLDDVHARYPGEELRCPHMRALEDAVTKTGQDL